MRRLAPAAALPAFACSSSCRRCGGIHQQPAAGVSGEEHMSPAGRGALHSSSSQRREPLYFFFFLPPFFSFLSPSSSPPSSPPPPYFCLDRECGNDEKHSHQFAVIRGGLIATRPPLTGRGTVL